MTGLYIEITQLMAKEIKRYTVQLFHHHLDAEDVPCPFGSSILMKNNKNFFLITAGHIFFEEEIKNIGIYIGNYIYGITGELNFHEPNSKTHDPQKLDLAIFKLDYIMVDLLKNYYDFLELEDLDLGHLSSGLSLYLVFGYPAQITKPNAVKKTMVPVSISLQTIGADFYHYKKHSIEMHKTIVLLGLQKNIHPSNINSLNKVSDFAGISGCGVWHITNVTPESAQYKLASILTGEDENKTIFFSTKVDAILSILALNNWQ